MDTSGFEQKPRHWKGVRFADDGVAEVRDGAMTVAVSRTTIQRITLRHGAQRRFWMLELIVGLVITLGALFPLGRFLIWLVRGEVLSTAMVWLGAAVLIGVGVMYDALRRGYFLDVETAEERTRISFEGKLEVREIETFLKGVEEAFGYEIERAVVTAGFPVKLETGAERAGK